MAETQRVASSPAPSRPAPKPRPRHPLRYHPPLRPGLDETHDLRPPKADRPPRPANHATAAAQSAAKVRRRPAAPSPRRELPPRSPAERVILAVLLSGLGLNLVALLTSSRLSRSDLLLGATVLFAGLVLLILIELCRRGSPPPAGEPD
jgi:hypothetical protein